MKRVRIVDVAVAAGVSRATVTNALNGTGRMMEATRQHVRAVAAALDYRPPGLVHRPAHSRTLALGVTTYGDRVWNFADVPYFSQVISGAMATAHKRGYGLTVLPAAPSNEQWTSLAADGVLLLDPRESDPVAHLLYDARVPLVFVGRPVEPWPDGSWVDNDHIGSVREVLDGLRAQGARRIALIAGPGTDHYTRTCIDTYRVWCGEHSASPVVVPMSHPNLAGAMFGGSQPPDAVYGIYDTCGHLMLEAAERHGLRVPDDLMIACMSEDPGYAATKPPVTTVSHSPRLGAQLAVEALIQLVETGTSKTASLVPARLVARRSTERRRTC